jgi:hypothetical protein
MFEYLKELAAKAGIQTLAIGAPTNRAHCRVGFQRRRVHSQASLLSKVALKAMFSAGQVICPERTAIVVRNAVSGTVTTLSKTAGRRPSTRGSAETILD